MSDDSKKGVHILVPMGFQGKELLAPGSNPEVPQDGVCIKCKGTGGIFHRVWLEDFEISDGKIVKATPKMAWTKCRCYKGQFWIKFNPLNVQARLMPAWEKEIREALETEKANLIRESGGNYEPYKDTFLKDIGYKGPPKQKIWSLDEVVKQSMQKKGDIQ